jgi:hypothetical protein
MCYGKIFFWSYGVYPRVDSDRIRSDSGRNYIIKIFHLNKNVIIIYIVSFELIFLNSILIFQNKPLISMLGLIRVLAIFGGFKGFN